MFERFDDAARQVVILASEEARMINHNYIGTEHLLLGILHDADNVSAKALNAVGVSLDVARVHIEDIIGHGHESPSGHIPYTPRSKKVLELAVRDSVRSHSSYVGAEHILRAIIEEGEGVAMCVLRDRLKLDTASLRRTLLHPTLGKEERTQMGFYIGLTDADRVALGRLIEKRKTGVIDDNIVRARLLERIARSYRQAAKEEQTQSA